MRSSSARESLPHPNMDGCSQFLDPLCIVPLDLVSCSPEKTTKGAQPVCPPSLFCCVLYSCSFFTHKTVIFVCRHLHFYRTGLCRIYSAMWGTVVRPLSYAMGRNVKRVVFYSVSLRRREKHRGSNAYTPRAGSPPSYRILS